MKSIKPGRGPSGMNAIGSIFAVAFGVIWTAIAATSGAPPLFPLFGVVFVCLGIVQAVYHYRNATGKNRYSSFDITDGEEEPDPLSELFRDGETGGRDGEPAPETPRQPSSDGPEPRDQARDSGDGYCPYCGAPVEDDFAFCRKCGKRLPPKQ